MSAQIRLDWRGPQVAAALLSDSLDGTELAGEHLLGASQALVPHEEGDLERSGTVTADRPKRLVAVAYDRPYAVKQHEDQTLRHDNGRSAKYLERPMSTERAVMLQIIATAARRRM